MINRYAKGRRLEYAVKKRLEAEGSLVFRTAGSHGAADLIEIQPLGRQPAIGSRVHLIQCKAGKPTAADRRELEAMKEKWGLAWFLAHGKKIERI